MTWTNVGDSLFLVGELVSVGLFMYGAWLSFTAHKVDTLKAPGVGWRSGATPAAKPLPPHPGAASTSEPFERGTEAYDDYLKLQG